MTHVLHALLGIDIPLVQAPMAGGPTTPELVAAVGNAGGLGSLGASFMSGKAIADACDKIKARTNKAYNVNLFVPEDHKPETAVLRKASAALDVAREQRRLPAQPLALRQPQVSKHLKVLAASGIVEVEPRARQRIYHLHAEPFDRIARWVDSFEHLWEVRLDSLGDYLAADEPEEGTP